MILPIPTVSEANVREHWSRKARRAKAQRSAAFFYVRKHPLPCVVTLTRVAPRVLDDDNLRGALKAVRDGVADRLGVDDGSPEVEWRYGQRRGLPRQYGVEVSIEARHELHGERGAT